MPRNDDDRGYYSAKDRAEKRGTGFASNSIALPEGVSFFTLDSDKPRRIDILPYLTGPGNPMAKEGRPYFERTFFTHRDIGPNGDTYICAAKTFNKPCPVCDFRARLARDPSADEKMVKEMAPKERQLFNVFDYGAPEKKIQLWDISFHLFGKLLDKRIRDSDERDGWDLFYHPTKGFTLKLGVKEEKGGGYTYFEVVSIDFQARDQPYKESIVEKTHCLDRLLIEPEYDKLKAVLLQTGDDDKKKKTDTRSRPDPDADLPRAEKEKPAPEKEKAKPAGDDDDFWSDRNAGGKSKEKPAEKEKEKPAATKGARNDDEW